MTQRPLVLFLSMVMTFGATSVRADRRIVARNENRVVSMSDFTLGKQINWIILAGCPESVDRPVSSSHAQPKAKKVTNLDLRPGFRLDGNWLALEINRRNDGIEKTPLAEIDGDALAQEINHLNDGLVRGITTSLPVRHNLNRSDAVSSNLSQGGERLSAGWQAASLLYASEALLTDLSRPATSASLNGLVAQTIKSGDGTHFQSTALDRIGKNTIHGCAEIQLDLDQLTPCAGNLVPAVRASTDEKLAQDETVSLHVPSSEGDANAQPFNDVHSCSGLIENGEANDWELAPSAAGQANNPVEIEVSPIASLPFSIEMDLDTISHTQENPELCWELPQATGPALNGWEETGVMALIPSISQVALGRRPDFNEQGMALDAFSPLAESLARSMTQVSAHIAAGAARTLLETLHLAYEARHSKHLSQARLAVPYRGL